MKEGRTTGDVGRIHSRAAHLAAGILKDRHAEEYERLKGLALRALLHDAGRLEDVDPPTR